MKRNILEAKTFNEARKKIKESKKPIIFSSNNDILNRKILEKEEIDTLLIPLKERKDFMKQRNSGLNHVLAKIAKKRNVTIGINIDEIIQGKNPERAKIISRVIQNIKICKKNKLNMAFISPSGKHNKDERDLKSLGLILGMSNQMLI